MLVQKTCAAPVVRPATLCAPGQQQTTQKVAATIVVLILALAAAPAAQAAQEVFMVAEGEPFIVQVGWGAVCVMFNFSLSLVVWGRSSRDVSCLQRSPLTSVRLVYGDCSPGKVQACDMHSRCVGHCFANS
ncbi:hypothetical protein DUNSADRAFT_12302 [Dunaliella salina]|uniref:Cytochrome b6-f complex subunit PetN n=1 Tax=Dunaliella salina TaxID=3046 RepID=A0ABQ7GBJ4_DUNSA|nr:hypothetical protein DUNSADRAFT_12302 [Dunaliella salina]|eukprot:KAF5831987.1 hypothetical protein DUNSADRAFT_12302 [Dunaliella salina]